LVSVANCLTVVALEHRVRPSLRLTSLEAFSSVAATAQQGVGAMTTTRSQPSVLIVDDEEIVRSFLRAALEQTAHVVEAADGERATAILAEPARPDITLVLLDHWLPRRSGLEVLRTMKERWPWIPVVLMTGVGSEQLAVEALRAGASDYLKKPVQLDTLMRTVENLIAAPRCLPAARPGGGRCGPIHPNIRRALIYIAEHFTEPITLADVARAAQLSRFHFCRLFHHETAVPFHDYLQELRITRAKALLADRYLRVTEIAYAVGFNDLSHFDRTFRKVVGCSPTAYRTLLRCA
jgi:two-component system, response regulator YesN